MSRIPKNMPNLFPILGVAAALSPLAVSDLARSAEGPQSAIVFVCEHGSSKSLVAAELFGQGYLVPAAAAPHETPLTQRVRIGPDSSNRAP